MRKIQDFTTEELIKELEARGFVQGYVHGHGDSEPVSKGEYVVGEVEKSIVIVFPIDIFKEPVELDKWF